MKSFRTAVIALFAVIISTALLPCSSPCQSDEEIKTIRSQVHQFYQQGRYNDAISLQIKVLKFDEGHYGPEHPDTAISINNLAELYRNVGDYAKAEPLYKRSLAIWEKALGPNHPNVGQSLNNLALLYEKTGRRAEAEALHKRSLAIREKTLGPDHISTAQSLNNLAVFYDSTGRLAEAEPLYKRSLAIYEKTFGPNHPNIGQPLYNLAVFYHKTGRYAEFEALCRRSLAIYEKTFGPDHISTAQFLNNLAVFYNETGRYAEAEPLFRRSLAIYEKTFGPDHISTAQFLNNLAVFYNETGRRAEAEALYKRSLAIREKALGPNHPDVANSLNNMAVLYRAMGDYAKAEPLYRRSLAIYEKTLGPDHISTAASLGNLAELYREMGDYAKAEPLYKRSLAIREKTLGPDHPDTATSLNNLALHYYATGRYAEAGALHKRSLAIREKTLGPDHPDVAASLNNLAYCYAEIGNRSEAHVVFRQAVSIQSSVRESIFPLLTEKQKLSFLKTQAGTTHSFLSHTLSFLGNNEAAVIDVFNTWLRLKGSVIEAQGNYLDALNTSDDPKVRNKLKELADVRQEIAKLQLSGLGKMTTYEYKVKITELQKKTESLESELMAMSKDFMLEKKAQTTDAKTLSSIIRKDVVYLDFAKTTLYDFQKKARGKSHYLLFLFSPGDTPQIKLTDIGTSEEVDKHISAYLKEMGRAKTEGALPDEKKLRREASALYDLLIKPVEPFLKGKKHLLISPDGNLNLIPFEALITPSGRYLMEGYLTSYVGAGRDMARFAPSSLKGGESLIIADPDYDLGQKGIEEAKASAGIRTAHVRAPVSRDAKGMRFDRLPDTKMEANAIEKVLKGKLNQKVRNYQNTRALEDILFNTSSPKVLHLATHGYFLTEEETKEPQGTPGFSLDSDPMKTPAVTIENPMLRSGVVLAGVNTSLREGRDEGMVTAEKILSLRLRGTDLVVLSACETGIGDIKSGEGVFGLKRAFILSGAKSLVMSLWSVPSKQTVDLMIYFYTYLSEGKTKAEALRQAKLDLVKKNPNPFFWGAFTMTGSP